MDATTAETFAMLDNRSLWQMTVRCDGALAADGVPAAVCGGVAVALQGYRRNTADVDMIVRRGDAERVRDVLLREGLTWNENRVQFESDDGVLQLLYAGDSAGRGTGVTVTDPEGDPNVEIREGIRVVRLSRLVEMKIACGEANVRRTHKDFADVVELIAARGLDGSFVRLLHRNVRETFRRLVRNARGEV